MERVKLTKLPPLDIASVSPWAKDAVLKMWNASLFKGDPQGNFNPRANANRAEAAVFCLNVDTVVKKWTGTTDQQAPKEPTAIASKPPVAPPISNNGSDEGSSSNGNSGGGNNNVEYTITFETNGGTTLDSMKLKDGSKLSSLPTPFKINYTFSGWFRDANLTDQVVPDDTIKQNMTLYAKYINANGLEEQKSLPFASKLDQSSGLTINITDATKAMTTDDVKSQIAYKCLSNPDYEVVISGGNGSFTVKGGSGGFPEGSTNKLELLDESLSFTDEDPTTDIYNFTIKKAEVLNLSLNKSMKYINAESISNVTVDGKETSELSVPLAAVETGNSEMILGTKKGTFTYTVASDEDPIIVGDSIAIYKGTRPDERTLEGDYKDDTVAYVTITNVNDTTYTYKNAESDDVLFTPDVLPISKDADTDGEADNNSITVPTNDLTFTDDKYAEVGLDATTTIDVGDFLGFYTGEALSDSAQEAGFARITKVEEAEFDDSYVISYEAATIDEITRSMDIYDTSEISGDEIIPDENIGALEKSIEEQANASGFADEAAKYLASVALETDGFKSAAGDFDLASYNIMLDDGTTPSDDVMLMANMVWIENKNIKANVGKKLQHFPGYDGLRCTLTLSMDVVIRNGDGSKTIVHMEGDFEEEIHFSLNVSGGAVWKKAWIFPYIADYRMDANIDVFNYTGIKFDAVVGSFGADETPSLDDNRWSNISNELKKIIESNTSDESKMESIEKTLTDKYSEMLKTDSDWQELFSIELFSTESHIDPLHILVYGISGSFVVSADINVAIGFELMYENAKRYNFSLLLFSKTSTNDTIVIKEEKYEFTFYVVGVLAVRAGIELEIGLGLFALDFASIGLSAEVGAYVRLWGYFYYHVAWSESGGKNSSSLGALLVEVGIYLEIKFQAQAFGGTFEYSPTLYEHEWPLWHAGSQQKVYDFSYPDQYAPKVDMKKKNYRFVLPDSVFKMEYMDMKSGEKRKFKVFDDEANFKFEFTNPAFRYDAKTNEVIVNPGDAVMHKGDMVITWKAQPLAFSSGVLSRTIPLKWEDLQGAFAIHFHTMGGSSIEGILAKTGISITAPPDPVKTGYTFGGWFKDISLTVPCAIPTVMGNEDVNLYAKWNPTHDRTYVVEHYQQGLGNGAQYTLVDTENLSNATTDSVVTVKTKSYEGFTAENTTVRILADNSAVAKVYYKRNVYNVIFQRNDGTSDNVTVSYKYGAAISDIRLGNLGYTFKKWTPDFPDPKDNPTMQTTDLTYKASWTPNSDTPYRVENYVQSVDGNQYTLIAIDNKIGETDTKLTLSDLALKEEGFTYREGKVEGNTETTTNIARTGDRNIKLFYTSDAYDITYKVKNGEDVIVSSSYGAKITRPNNPVKEGYNFSGWFIDEALTIKYKFGGKMPANALTIYGELTKGDDGEDSSSYTVEHYVEQLDGNYVLKRTDNKTGKANEVLTLETLQDKTIVVPDGITYKEAKIGEEVETEATLVPDSNLLAKLYYQRESHTLTLKPDNGESDIKITEKYGATITAPDIIKENYTFLSWSPKLPETMPAQDGEHTAQWTDDSTTGYVVEHYQEKAQGGYEIHESIPGDGAVGETITATSQEYDNFTLNAGAEDAVPTGKIVEGERLVLKLYYDRDMFTITYNPQGGTLEEGDTSAECKWGVAVETPTPAINTESTFAGWYLEAECTTSFDGVMPAENTTVYAKWTKAAVYNIDFDSNEGEGTMSVQTIPIGDTQKLSKNTYTRKGYKFLGWGDNVTSDVVYDDEELVTDLTTTADDTITLYAQWEIITYTITYENGGTPPNPPNKATYTIEEEVLFSAPTLEGSRFLGWHTDAECTNKIEKIPKGSFDNLVVYGKWGTNKVNVIMISEYGDREEKELMVGDALPVPKNPSGYDTDKNGGIFSGWCTDTACTSEVLTEVPTNQLGDLIVYAKWTGGAKRPFEISTAEDFMKLKTKLASTDPKSDRPAWERGHFKLTADIDLSNAGFEPINGFGGTLDGDGHSITLGIDLPNEDNIGLFGQIRYMDLTDKKDAPVFIKNLTIKGSISGKNYVGGFVGIAFSQVIIENVSNEASSISGGLHVGGIAGLIGGGGIGKESEIKGSFNKSPITGKNYVGGIVGSGQSMIIEDCSNTARGAISDNNGGMSASSAVGGIVGAATRGAGSQIIKGCSNQGIITDTTPAGIPSWASGIISFSNGAAEFEPIEITNCRQGREVEGMVKGDKRQIAANDFCIIKNCEGSDGEIINFSPTT